MAETAQKVGQRSATSEPPDHGLEVLVEERDDTTKIVLSGELDVSTVSRFNAAIAKTRIENCKTVVIDLRDLKFMDSTGLSAVLVAEMHARTRRQRFAVVRGPRHVQELFRLTGVDHFLEVIDDPSDLSPKA